VKKVALRLFLWFLFVAGLSRMSATVPVLNALKIFTVIGQLKTLKRTGWVQNDVALPESVADHMYRMSMLSFFITDPTINRDKLMKICLCHDLAEAIVGDITPYDGVSKEEKKKLEEDALRKIVSDIGHAEIADEILSLWLEYENGTSKEAEIAKNLDKFEMIIQADEYEKTQGKKLDRFFESTKDSFTHPEVLAWNNALRDDRNARLSDL